MCFLPESLPVPLSVRQEGYEVFVATDASGTFNKTTLDAAWARMSAAGCQLMSWFGIACELHPIYSTFDDFVVHFSRQRLDALAQFFHDRRNLRVLLNQLDELRRLLSGQSLSLHAGFMNSLPMFGVRFCMSLVAICLARLRKEDERCGIGRLQAEGEI
jgi:Isochorismatase family